MVRPSPGPGRRKLILRFATIFSCLAILAGTGAEASSAAPRCRPSRTRRCPAPAKKPVPVRGGTLVVALTADPGQLNPAITTSGVVHPAAEPMFNGLVSIGEDSKPVGELAESWRIGNGGARYTFTLRKNVTWHDGRPFTSADVKYTYEQVLLKFHARTKASMADALDGIDTPNALTVVFRFKRPYAPLLQQMDVTEGPILPRHIYDGTDPLTNPANTRPIGTGPFKFVSYDQGSQITLARNPTYFRAGLPYFDKMVLRVIPDASTRIVALEAGEVDWLPSVPIPASDRARLNTKLALVRTAWNPGGSNCIMTMSYNLDRPVLRDVRVRRAIAFAIDRDQFLSQVLFGEGRVADAPISSGIPFAHATDVNIPGFSPTLANQLLDQAGWPREGDSRVARGVSGVPDGTRLALDFVQRPADAKYGEIVRQRLGTVGIAVTLRNLEDLVFRPTIFRDRNFDLNVISYCNGTDPQIGVRRMFVSSQIGPTDFTNSSAYRNGEVDALFDQAAQAVDRNEARKIYRRIQAIVVDDLPYLWLVETVNTRAHPAACTGFRYNSGLFAEAAFCRR
ncbi:MAG: ABC transporter substrate-binding protein [Acidimicrobiales bacterium]